MSISLSTDGGTLTNPGAYPQIIVNTQPGGLGTTGVVAVVGEAEAGPSFAEETDLSLNIFGPSQISDLAAKYGSGPLLDAAKGAVAASADNNITGSLQGILVVKTNTGVKALSSILAIGSGAYATLRAKKAGRAGNLLARTITQKTAEALPTISALYAPTQQNTVVALRVSGGAEVLTTLNIGILPSAAVTALDGLAGVAATGGTNRSVVTAVAGTIQMFLDSGFACHLVVSTAWANTPSVGDLVYIPTGSPMAAANEGSYVVVAATTTRLDLYKLIDAVGADAARTAPANEGPTAIAATTDVQAFAPVTITLEAGAVAPGLGKSLEVAESGSHFISNNFYTFTSATASPPAAVSTFVSTLATPRVLTSATEYRVTLTSTRSSDSINEALSVGGDVLLTLGYKGTSGSAVIASGVLTISVVGGAGTSPAAITLTDYPTIADLCTYLNTLTGFTAAPGTTALGSKASTGLDAGTYTLGSTQGAKTGRIKGDGAAFLSFINSSSAVVEVIPVAPATSLVGLPATAVTAFLAGGSKGATSDAAIGLALTALESTRVNFVVPTFARDATADITDNLTDVGSTYTIDSINAAVKTHVLLMSQLKRRRPRQGFVAKRGTYLEAKNAAGNLAHNRIALAFQDCKDLNSQSTITQFQPWMLAAKAAGMQAAGFYRALVHKFINCSGVVQAAADFNDQNDDATEDALKAGLLIAQRDEAGGFRFVSDQTTYTRDDNFVFNSISATYNSDVIATTIGRRMELAFVGQSVADISAALALTTLEAIADDLLRLKLVAPSIDAPRGFKNAKIRMAGPVMYVEITVKLAGAIYLIPIRVLVEPVQQSAG